MLMFTVITATAPKCITKQFTVESDGTLTSKTSASVYKGSMRRVNVADAHAFAEVLMSLRTDQCLVYGLSPRDAELTTEKEWVKLGRPDNPLPRTKEVMSWSSGPGVMLLDYDAPKDGAPPLSKDQLLSLVEQVTPEMLKHDMIWWPSTSSLIYAGETELRGIRGQRLYPMVLDATDIPRAGKALNERLWAKGHGRYEVSKSGSLLERPVFDGSVWQTNRIDFAAGAACGTGLKQRRGKPIVMKGALGPLLDTRAIIPDLTQEEMTAAKSAKDAARAEKSAEAAAVRDVWIEAAVDAIVRRHPRIERVEARKQAQRAVERRDLMGDWVLQVRDAVRQEHEVTVLEVLDNPAKYDGMQTKDPLEPEYDGSRWVGKLFLYGARPVLYSMAHGGVTFRLTRQPQRIEVVKGKGSETTDALLNALRSAPDVFDFGAELSVVGGGTVHALDENSLRYEAGKLTQFWYRKDGDEALCDPPSAICRNVLSMGTRRGLKKLTAVITAPTLRPDGSVLSAPGFDADTGLLFDADFHPQPISEYPTRERALAALDCLWKPFAEFPFVGALDRAVHLAALLTSAVRCILPTAPAFAYDAPAQGSGKTLLARCVGVLTEGKDPSVWPHTAGRDDEEVRKRLFAVLRSGARSLVWDNIVGTFDSASLAAALTNPTFSDRVLGTSLSSTVPNRMILLMTGNNLTLAGDMARRVLVSRIDPQTDKPFARSFNLDPAAYCLLHRNQMIESALVLIRAMLTHSFGKPGSGKMASFEHWDAWVRQTVIYANELWPETFGDVMGVVQANQAEDPEQETLAALLNAWHGVFGSTKVQTSEVLRRATLALEGPELREALEDFAPNGHLTAKSVGRLLKYRIGRICGGKRLECVGDGAAGRFWRVSEVPPP